MGLFIKKPLADLMTEANDSGSKSLKRILGPWSLIALGVGVIIGAGLFSITGAVAAGYTGPAITLSLIHISGPCHYFIFRYRRLGLLFRRVMLRRVRIHDPGGR